MNWVNALCDLYEKNEMLAGKYQYSDDDKQNPLVLLPLSHTTVLAQIEVTLDKHGNFLRARSLSKEEAYTLIPVTEDSAIRTSGVVSHPLMDNLQYIAGDYDNFAQKKVDKKDNAVTYRERFDEYIRKLAEWCSSDYAHPKAETILAYLKKEMLIGDLVQEKVLLINEDGTLQSDKKIQEVLQEKSFVRFRIETGEMPDINDETGRFASEIWLDTTLQKSYVEYNQSQSADTDLCYLTGKIGRTTGSYSKKIRHEGDGTKLLSSNDSDGYTFRGRFHNSGEAFSIGYEASQKAQSALKWIIRKQGYRRDGLCVVTWESDLKPYVSVFDDSADVVMNTQDELFDDSDDKMSAKERDTNPITAKQFNTALNGYLKSVENTSNMMVMALDAATPGRLAMTYFNRLPSAHYLDNIKFWHGSCCWKHVKFVNKRRISFEGMASLNDIALALYGTEQNSFLKLKTDPDGKAPMLVSAFQRLTPCMLERKRIPRDLERLAVLRASNPLAFERYNWLKILSIACSLVKKSKSDWKEEEWNMALQHDCKDRSYLYGRLLAVADLAEKTTYDKDDKNKRVTNAMRYMNVFSRRPFRTWQIIEERLKPYFSKLIGGNRVYFEKLFNEIHEKFTTEVYMDDSALDGLYLLGYHSQLQECYSGNKDLTENENEEGGEE